MKAVVFLLFVAFAVVSAQTVVRYAIDDFSVQQGQAVTLTLASNLQESDPSIIESDSSFTNGCNGMIGCARDMIIEATSGGTGRSFTSNVFPYDGRFSGFDGEWGVSNPKSTSAIARLQYDGNDNSRSLDINGLGGFDMTDGGLARSVRFSIVSDLEINLVINLYSPNGGTCEIELDVPVIIGNDYSLEDTLIDVDFDDFDGNCNLESIGAVEFSLRSSDAVDVLVRTFVVVGLPDPVTPTRTPSPSRALVPSVTPTPAASQSRTPSATPSPSLIPGFTWYTFDDDDNGRSPCDDERPRRTYWVSDDNVIYYYFFGAAENYVVDDDGSASSGSILAAGLSLVAAALFI